jgi:hypothetical protein
MDNGSGGAVVVVSDQLLLADSVAAALSSRGFRTRPETWPPRGDLAPASLARHSEVGVALFESGFGGEAAADLLARGDIPWIVIPSAHAAPGLGATLDRARITVLPHSSSLQDLVTAVAAAVRSTDPLA